MKAKDLRNSILQMAVQGKLVPQDPNDEPASVLVERIRAERARLIKEKKIRAPKGGESVIYRASDGSHYEKRGKGEPVCIDDEIPFEIPESWAWARLESCCRAVIDCPHSTPVYLAEATGFYAIDTNCMDEAWNQTGLRYLSEESYEKRIARYAPQPGDLVLSREGSIGRSVILNQENVCLGQRVMVLGFFDDGLLNRYCQAVLTSPYAWSLYMAANVGTGVKHINVSMIKDILIPLPPRGEQVRVIEMVDNLQPHIDQYGALEDARERLDAELPDRLRKSVLQLAVQGRLVEQNPADEPASVLLERIRTERAILVKAKKIRAPKGGESVIYRASDGGYYEKRGKGESVCIDDEIPFEIPESWEWCRLITALREIVVPQRDKPTSFDGDIAWCRIEDVEGRYLNRAQDGRYVSQETVMKMNLRICPSGTVFSACSGASIGRIAISTIECCTNQTFAGLVCSSGLFNEYLYVFLETVIPQLKQMGSGTTLAYISQAKYANILLPLPPIEEQKRIVASIEAMREQLG